MSNNPAVNYNYRVTDPDLIPHQIIHKGQVIVLTYPDHKQIVRAINEGVRKIPGLEIYQCHDVNCPHCKVEEKDKP